MNEYVKKVMVQKVERIGITLNRHRFNVIFVDTREVAFSLSLSLIKKKIKLELEDLLYYKRFGY